MMNRKYLLMILLIILCSVHTIAQSDYYYYKDKKIPLIANEDKVCVSIPKCNKNTIEKILANVQFLNKIEDETFDIFIISRSDYEKLTSLDFWKEDSKSVLLTQSYSTENGHEVFASPYLNIRLKKEEDIATLTSYAGKYGLKIIKQDSLMPLWYILAITQDSDINTVECANKLWESGQFAASVPDLCSKNLTCSNDPDFYQQWGLQNNNNNYADIDISVTDAWNYATGKNIKIAIIDTGVELNHSDLELNIDSLSYNTETGLSPSQIYEQEANHKHGTHCAGIAAAIKDNNRYIAGVAPDAKIISISNKLGYSTCTSLKLADGIVWAYEHGADIISNSWHAEYHPAINEAIYNAFRYGRHGKGCVIVFASGNQINNESFAVDYPANCNDTVLAVGSIDRFGERATDSKYGAALDLVAPGVNILSVIPNDTIESKSGTSMACPHVAGVAALILQRNSELTVSQVDSIICRNAKKISNVIFNESKPYGLWDNKYGYGLVDAYNSARNTPSTVYIQNDSITGSRVISGENIYVGRNVTDTKEHGNVILGQGNIMLQARSVEIKNSTIVPLGTTLTIE